MTRLVGELGKRVDNVLTWSCNRYRTMYFSDFPQAAEWADRLAMAWAVEIEIDSDVDPADAGTHGPGPYGSRAFDDTFADEDEDWERTRDRVMVIAGTAYGSPVDVAGWESTEGVLSVNAEIFEGMIGLDLGELDLSDGMSRIDEVHARCRERGLRTNWKDAGTSWFNEAGLEPPASA